VFLIDTMVLSELRLRQRDPGVVAWISSQRPEDCFLSVVSLGEIERGIARKRTSDAGGCGCGDHQAMARGAGAMNASTAVASETLPPGFQRRTGHQSRRS
jgi:hypothetical protein